GLVAVRWAAHRAGDRPRFRKRRRRHVGGGLDARCPGRGGPAGNWAGGPRGAFPATHAPEHRAGGDSGGDGHHRAACPRGRIHLLGRGSAVHGQALLPRSHLHSPADLPVTRPSIATELAGALRGTFRAELPSQIAVSAELLRSARVSGVEALLARRMGAPDRATERYQILEQALRERRLATLLAALDTHRVRAATFKGWALSRLYPAGLRPVGDVDLAVHPDDEEHARA